MLPQRPSHLLGAGRPRLSKRRKLKKCCCGSSRACPHQASLYPSCCTQAKHTASTLLNSAAHSSVCASRSSTAAGVVLTLSTSRTGVRQRFRMKQLLTHEVESRHNFLLPQVKRPGSDALRRPVRGGGTVCTPARDPPHFLFAAAAIPHSVQAAGVGGLQSRRNPARTSVATPARWRDA
jgi:hypothetical protein